MAGIISKRNDMLDFKKRKRLGELNLSYY